MRSSLLSVIGILSAFVGLGFADPMVLDQKIMDRVNQDSQALWKAGTNDVFEGRTMSEIRHLLGGFLVHPETLNMPTVSFGRRANELPENFDTYKQWPACAHPAENQESCGSCWAFSSATALTDRFCIATGRSDFPLLSPQDMISCDSSNFGCNGGYLTNTWKYLENYGVVTQSCLPYVSGQGFIPSCPTRCARSSESFKKYKAKAGSTQRYATPVDAQTDIALHGPIQAGFMVYQDFFAYKTGIYHHVSGGLAGGHAVVVTGWGVENNVPYWIVKNSWGPEWGDEGFFKIRRGNNECSFESQLFAGLPLVE